MTRSIPLFSMLGLLYSACLLCLPRALAAESYADTVLAASLPPQAYLIRELAPKGTLVEVMFRPGVSHETFEPTVAQVRALSHAKVYFKLGHPQFTFERSWLNKLLAERNDLRVVDCSAGISFLPGDIHFWLSPTKMRKMAENIAAALLHAFPDEATNISARLTSLLHQIEQLGSELQRELQPFQGRTFLVYHPVWAYFAADFGLHQLAVEKDGKEPGLSGVQKLLAISRKKNVKDIFVEPATARESAKVIAEELGGKVLIVDPLAENWPENLRAMTFLLRESFLRSGVPGEQP